MPTNVELCKKIQKLLADLNKVPVDSTAYSAIVEASGLGLGLGLGAVVDAGVPGRPLETYFNGVEIDPAYSRTALSAQRPNNAVDLYLGKVDPDNSLASAGVAIELPVIGKNSSMLFSINLGPSTFADQTAVYVVTDPDNLGNILASEALSPGGSGFSSVNTTGLEKVLAFVYLLPSASNDEGARLTIDSLSLSEFQQF